MRGVTLTAAVLKRLLVVVQMREVTGKGREDRLRSGGNWQLCTDRRSIKSLTCYNWGPRKAVFHPWFFSQPGAT